MIEKAQVKVEIVVIGLFCSGSFIKKWVQCTSIGGGMIYKDSLFFSKRRFR